jgi:hypothetical protein
VRIQLLFFSVSFLLSLAIGELGLRLLPKFAPQPRAHVGLEADRANKYFVPDPELGWRMRPHDEIVVETDEYRVAYRSNALGYREERRAEPAPDARRIALVGDSFTFGQGVPYEQTFGALLEASLPQSEVRNFALPGYGVDQMWVAARKLALPLEPALLIVAFISEDFTRSLTAYRYDLGLNKPFFTLDGGSLRAQTPADAPPRWLWLAQNRSRLWAGVRQVMRLLGHHYPLGAWWSLNRAILDALRADARAAGVRVLFVYLHAQHPRPFPALAAYMKQTSADFVDLGNEPPSPPRELNFPDDGHPNPEGHRYTADAILAWIGREMPELTAPPGG